jgi:hypothetical protein
VRRAERSADGRNVVTAPAIAKTLPTQQQRPGRQIDGQIGYSFWFAQTPDADAVTCEVEPIAT